MSFAILAALLAALGLIACVGLVRAQRRDRALDLARVCAHEAGVDVSVAECAAIYGVMIERCGGDPRCQSPRVFDTTRRDERAWFAHADRRGREPAQWPRYVMRAERRVEHPRWSSYRAAWLSLIEVADAIVAGDVDAPCSAQAWGGTVDLARAARLRLIEVDCGATTNRFYLYPRGRR